MALRDDEGRGKLRKATGNCKRVLIRRCPNGETQYCEAILPLGEVTQGTETSKYLEEKKTISDSASSGERTRRSPNRCGTPYRGCRTCIKVKFRSGMCWKAQSKRVKIPYTERS